MAEKYEKPQIFSQKMELNVLRATCQHKEVTYTADSLYNYDMFCESVPGCGAGCEIVTPSMS
jgi:hypothetical protein